MAINTQSILTAVLAVAVTVLVVDRTIEPAQAQSCASSWDVEDSASKVISRVLFCMDGSRLSNERLSTYCNS